MSEVQPRRKRAVCYLPLAVIEEKLGLDPDMLITTMQMSYENMRSGVVELIVEGSALDDHFVTYGEAIYGEAQFHQDEAGQMLTVVPPLPDPSKENEKNAE